MKIAFMMRTIDQDNSFGVFTTNLLRTLLKMDRTNSYLLLYNEPKHFGRFANFANVNCLALGIHLGVLLFVVAVPLSLLIARLPIGLYSLGTIEGAFVFLLSGLGLSGADAVAMSLSARILERL